MGKKRLIPIIIIVLALAYFGVKEVLSKTSNENVFYGIVEADTMNVSPEVSGKISDVYVLEGQTVRSGDVLAKLYSDEGQIKLDIANISKDNAKNELSKLEEGSRIEEINAQRAIVNQAKAQVKQGEALLKQAENNLNSAKINLDYKKKIYDDYKALYDKNSISKYEFDSAKNQLDLALVSYENAKQQVEYSKAQLEGFKAQLVAAEEKLNLLVKGATEKTKTTAKLNLKQAEKSAELSKLYYDKYTMISPIDGIVETVNYNKGEFVSLGSPVVTILDMNNMYVKIFVPEKVLPQIKIGQEVDLKSDFIKDKTIKGQITYISPEAEFTPMNIVTKEDRTKLVFAVKIKILDNLDSVKPGMLLDVIID